MASLYPAEAIGRSQSGRIAAGERADVVHLSDDLSVHGVLIAGEPANS
jgi:N-acetylglucosamine-6-phosphate deacetylase